jgi:hypothetical protein
MINPLFSKMRQFRSRGVVCLLAAAALFLSPAPAQSGAPPPNGINIGLDFNWANGPAGDTASFIESSSPSGATLVNCSRSGPVTGSTSACDFAFTYSIGGTPQTPVAPEGLYVTWPTPGTGTGIFCGQELTADTGLAPLTLWNCFNADSFGQVFVAGATGASRPSPCR